MVSTHTCNLRKGNSLQKRLSRSSRLWFLQQRSLNNCCSNLIATIKAKAIVPCSLTLDPTEVDLDIEVNEDLDNFEEIAKNNSKILDILPIIWENILVEIPTKVVGNKLPEKISGDGWQLITEEQGRVNPELEKLKDLL